MITISKHRLSFRSRDKPARNSLNGSQYRFFFGSTTSGKSVTERSSMQMTAVYSCVRILSEAIAGLPLHLYRYTEKGGKEKAVDHCLYKLLHDEPNGEMTSFSFRETLMTHLLLWGNAYAQIIRNGNGEIIALYPLMPNKMVVDRDKDGQIYYEYRRTQEDSPTLHGSVVYLAPHDVLHIPGLGFDGLVGYSPIAMAKNAIGMAVACEEYGAKFFANGASPGGVLEHPGVVKDPEKLRDSWNSVYQGSGNSHRILSIAFIVWSCCEMHRLDNLEPIAYIGSGIIGMLATVVSAYMWRAKQADMYRLEKRKTKDLAELRKKYPNAEPQHISTYNQYEYDSESYIEGE